MTVSLHCGSTSKNARETESRGIGTALRAPPMLCIIADQEDLLHGATSECVHPCRTTFEETRLPRTGNRKINCTFLYGMVVDLG